MRTLVNRTVATIVAIALILYGSDALDAQGRKLWLGYGAIAVGMVLAYYALTGRTLLPERGKRK
jgi:Flp pilus assembly protein protease CpaA